MAVGNGNFWRIKMGGEKMLPNLNIPLNADRLDQKKIN